MLVPKFFFNHANRATTLADQGSNGERTAIELDGAVGHKLNKSKTLVGEEPRSLLTNYAIVGKVPVEIRLGPIPIRFHARILPPRHDKTLSA